MNRKGPIEIPFSSDVATQKKVAKAGGYIHIQPSGKPVFRFDSRDQFRKFEMLKQLEGA